MKIVSPKIQRVVRAIAASAAAALALSTAAAILSPSPAAEERAGSGAYLRYRMPGDPPNLDPIRANDENSLLYIVNIFDGLVEFSPGGLDVVPAVAESWTLSPDGRTYTFHLRKGVRFHDGRPVTSADALFSLKRVLDPKSPSALRPFLETIRGAADFASGRSADLPGLAAPDDATLTITLEHPFGPFLAVMATQAGSIVPRDLYADPNEAYLRRPVGCGPFRLESWDQGVSLKLAAFADHWKGKPGLAGVSVRFIPSVATALEEYKTGGLDFDTEVPAGQRAWVRENLPADYRVWPRLATAFVAFNHLAPPFKGNAPLRRALGCAVDRDRIARVLQQGKDTPATRLMPPGMPGHDPSPGPYRYDPVQAKRLLAEAGYPDGKGLPEITYLVSSNESIRRYAEAAQADFAAVGVKVRLQVLDFGAYLRAIDGTKEGGASAPLFQFIWFADYPDPDAFLRPLLHSANFGSAGNYGRYGNADVDRLLDEGRRESDPAKREAIYRKAEAIALADACAIPLYYYGDDALVSPRCRASTRARWATSPCRWN